MSETDSLYLLSLLGQARYIINNSDAYDNEEAIDLTKKIDKLIEDPLEKIEQACMDLVVRKDELAHNNKNFHDLFAGKPKNWTGYQVEPYSSNASCVLREIGAKYPNCPVAITTEHDHKMWGTFRISLKHESDPKREFITHHSNPAIGLMVVAYKRLIDDLKSQREERWNKSPSVQSGVHVG